MATPKPLNLSAQYTLMSGQLGSNQGGFFKRNSDNKEFYMKWLPSGAAKEGVKYTNRAENRLHNEFLASKLYELFGVAVPQSELFTFIDQNGQKNVGIASEKQDNIRPISQAFGEAGQTFEHVRQEAQKDFLIDALLSNYDVVGLVMDNLHYNTQTNEPVRIDPGGALKYRAQGTAKKEQFNEHVHEFEEMESGNNTKTKFNAQVLQQASRIFKGVHESPDALHAGLSKLQSVTDQQIRDCVNEHGFDTSTDKGLRKNEQLISLLLTRRAMLITKTEEKLRVSSNVQAHPETDEDDGLLKLPAQQQLVAHYKSAINHVKGNIITKTSGQEKSAKQLENEQKHTPGKKL